MCIFYAFALKAEFPLPLKQTLTKVITKSHVLFISGCSDRTSVVRD